jgi:hypothetical protein
MEKYFRLLRWGDKFGEEFWCMTDEECYQLNVISSSGLSRFCREPGEDISATLDKIAPGGEWHELSYKPGKYFPRMARPNSINEPSPGRNPDPSDEFRHYRARSTGQLHAFIEELDQICRVIHPDGCNLRMYGHATRNILILACTEVEAHWRKILKDNGYKRNGRLNTTDYVNLLSALRLDQYVVNLNYYPWLPTITPFDGWKNSNATKSIPWYHAYNQVKHDREGHFPEATLERALTAVTACFVMLCAQYGLDFALQGKEAERAFFQLIRTPQWEPFEFYVPAFDKSYQAQNYPFTIRSDRI